MDSSVVIEFLFTFLSTLPYLSQLKKLYDSNSYDGFHIATPLITLASLGLRLTWWAREHYQMYLFIQAAMLSTINLLIVYKIAKINKEQKIPTRSFLYNKQIYYTRDFVIFSLVNTLLSYFISSPIYSSAIGYAGLILEAFMLFPQVMIVLRSPAESGLSIFTVLGWFAGDLCKLTLFVNTDAPPPFILCAALQVLWDSLVFGIPFARKVFPPLDILLRRVFKYEPQSLV